MGGTGLSGRPRAARRSGVVPARWPGEWWLASSSRRSSRGIRVLRWPVEPIRAAGSADLPPTPRGRELIYQPKWDGFRALAWIGPDWVALQSRYGRDLTRYFPKVQESRQTGARERSRGCGGGGCAAADRPVDRCGRAGVARPACPRCARMVALVKWHDGARVCARCDKQVRAAPCAQCGVQREVHSRDDNGQPRCANCTRRDPGKAEQCVRCGRMRPVNTRTPHGPRCASCRTIAVGVCGLCGGTAPCKRSVVSGLSRCLRCTGRRARCRGCGQARTVHSGTHEDPRCAVCTVPGPDASPRRWHACTSCGQKNPSTGDCASCRLVAVVRPLLTAGDQVRPELRPLLAWWENVDQPASVRTWLRRRPAARALLRALADVLLPRISSALVRRHARTRGECRRGGRVFGR
jgi:hypothetical protein